jgi:hypothetical protein
LSGNGGSTARAWPRVSGTIPAPPAISSCERQRFAGAVPENPARLRMVSAYEFLDNNNNNTAMATEIFGTDVH